MSKQLIAQLTEAAKACVAEEKVATSNESIKRKLDVLSDICERLATVAGEKPLTIAEAVRRHKDLSGQTIRNGGPKGNRYLRVFRAWERVADAVVAADRPTSRKGVQILNESDLHTIKDPVLRHQITLVFAQNKSRYNEINILKKLLGEREIRLSEGPEHRSLPGGEGLVLTSAELDAVRDFINPKKMKAKHLKPSKDDGVHTVDGQAIADPGFLSALRKISKSYELPE